MDNKVSSLPMDLKDSSVKLENKDSSLVSYVSNNSCNADLTSRPEFNYNQNNHLGKQKSIHASNLILNLKSPSMQQTSPPEQPSLPSMPPSPNESFDSENSDVVIQKPLINNSV